MFFTPFGGAIAIVLSGAIYLPIEIYALVHHATALKAVVLLINLGIVGYVGYVRLVRPPEAQLGSVTVTG